MIWERLVPARYSQVQLYTDESKQLKIPWGTSPVRVVSHAPRVRMSAAPAADGESRPRHILTGFHIGRIASDYAATMPQARKAPLPQCPLGQSPQHGPDSRTTQAGAVSAPRRTRGWRHGECFGAPRGWILMRRRAPASCRRDPRLHSGRVIPSVRMRERSVLGAMPRRPAALPSPLIFHPDSSSARRIRARSSP